MILSMMAIMPSGVSASLVDRPADDHVARATTSWACESAHPYSNNFDYTWTKTIPGATEIKIYFTRIEIEKNYDALYIYDGNNVQKYKIDDDYPNGAYTGFIAGDTVKIRLDTDYSVAEWGFKVDYLEYNGGGGGGGPTALTNGVGESGTINTVNTEYDYFYLDVGANAENMHVVLTCGSNDFDFFASDATETPDNSNNVFKGYTSGGEDVNHASPSAARWYFSVNSYSGTGAYTLTVTVTFPVVDTTAPTVSITNPSNGATVQDTVTISFSASDANGIASRVIKIDGVTVSSSSSYSWDTTAYTDGSHTIRCEATDPSSNTGFDQHTVTVSNPTQSNVLTSGVPATSSLGAQYATEMWEIVVPADTVEMEAILTCGSADFDLYGRRNAEPTTSTYDWRGYTSGGEEVTTDNPGAGTWYIMVRSYSGTGSYQLTVTLTAGGGGGGGGGALTDGVTSTGSLAAQGATEMWNIVVPSDTASMEAILTCGSADFDLYGRLGAEPTTSTYDWRGYTGGGEEVTTSNPGAGTWYIMVRSYSGTGSYQLTVTLTAGGGGGGGTGDKYALIVGISNYKSISDLSYCDEDANDWYNYLTTVCDYPADNIVILGDGTSSYAKTPAGKATEVNYKFYLNWLCDQAADEIAFITSGHGAGDGSGSSYLCAWDCGSGESGEDGDFYDTEIRTIMTGAAADKIFVFVDHCYSGGLIPEIAMAMGAKGFITTTCTEDGYGWDEPSSQNGAWTNEFLHDTLETHYGSNPNTAMEDAFAFAESNYSHTGGDAPMMWDGNTGSPFTL